jgi:hypothetical protein
MSNLSHDPNLTLTAERAEAAALMSFMRAPARDVSARLGMSLLQEGGAVAAFVPAADVLALNRVIGLGVHAAASETQLDRILAAAKSAGVRRLFLQITPDAQPAELTKWIEARGGVPHNRWVRLWRGVHEEPLPEATLKVVQVRTLRADAFAHVVRIAFGMPEMIDPMLTATVGTPGWQHYVVRNQTKVVATGAFFAVRGVAWLGFAATLPDHRGAGAQSSLIATRLRAAAAMDCRMAVTETMEETPEHPVQSYRNMLRLGFHEAYHRQNFVVTLA